MRQQFLGLIALTTVLTCLPLSSAKAIGGARSHGSSHGARVHGPNQHGPRHGFGDGFGFDTGVGGDYGWDVAELYRELFNNLPYFALHPPVYYSEPVPRTYGYSPFAYPPGTMTPEIVGDAQPVTINNPYVPATTPVKADIKPSDRSASNSQAPEPLVIRNPFVLPASSVAKGG